MFTCVKSGTTGTFHTRRKSQCNYVGSQLLPGSISGVLRVSSREIQQQKQKSANFH